MSESEQPTYYAACRACDWRTEFTEGALINDVDLPTSAERRLAGHSAHNDCTSENHDHGWCNVLEAKVTVELTMHFPLGNEASPVAATEDTLYEAPFVRHVDDITLDQAYVQEQY